MSIPIALRTIVQFIPQPPLTRSMRVYPLGWLMGDVSRIKTASSATSLRFTLQWHEVSRSRDWPRRAFR
jgi:hypothetical protein